MKIYIRKEIYENEYRSPLVPHDIQVLTKNKYTFFIQESDHRIFTNVEFQDISGVELTTKEWFDPEFQNCFILGIKELNHLEKLNHHIHCYFSHSFKQQTNSSIILQAFSKTKSILHDIEYLLDKQGNRLIAFGYYAGLTGAILGLQEYSKPTSIENLKPWASFEAMVASIQLPQPFQPKILVIGSKGRCGSGVCAILDTFHLSYTTMNKGEKKDVQSFDIIFNCILLHTEYKELWFPSDFQTNRKIVIVDISCDYSKPNNPIQLYSAATTWKKPVYKPSEHISIIAIENLPSLLPRESSIHFSKQLTRLLLENDEDIWQSNKNYFLRCLTDKKLN